MNSDARQSCKGASAVCLWLWEFPRAVGKELPIQCSNENKTVLSDHCVVSVPHSKRNPMALVTENQATLID